jgi:DNA-binding transcriptional LysR family regulator
MMRRVNFDIDCLRSFLVVADTMNISQAAENVGRAQSTVSQQIAKLEAQVGRELLTRRRGRVLELTAEGERLVNYARRMLQLNDEAYSSICGDTLTGSVRVGVPLDFFGRDVMTWLARFKQRHPGVTLEVEANQSENLMRRSERGEFDLAFFKQEVGARRGVVALTEQMVWVGGPNYSPTPDESVPLILFPEGCAYRRFAIATLEASKRHWHVSFVGPSFDCLRSAVTEGLGVSVLSRALVTSPLRIVRREVALPQLPAVELAYSCGKRSKSRIVTELANFLSDSLLLAVGDSVRPRGT